MDSFFDEPRITPKPTPIIHEIETPTVPEVSLMFQNVQNNKLSPVIPLNHGKTLQSYNAWKLQTNTNNKDKFDSFLLTCTSNKENTYQTMQDKFFLSKKQVRFEGSDNKFSSVSSSPGNKSIQHLLPLPSLNKTSADNSTNHTLKRLETHASRNDRHNVSNQANNLFQTSSADTLKRLETLGISKEARYTPNKISPTLTNSIKPSKPSANSATSTNSFEKMYYSGIPAPNKELDLSFLEPQNNPCPRQNFLNKSVTDTPPSMKLLNYVDHYKSNQNVFDKHVINSKSCEIATNQGNNCYDNKTILDLTVNDQEKVTKLPTENVEHKVEETPVKLVDSDDGKKAANEGPSVHDLLQIIKLQNDQLQRLQNQVEKLVKISENSLKEQTPTTIEAPRSKNVTYKDKQVGTSFCEEIVEQHIETNKNTVDNNSKQISVGMMTSFEFSFKPPVAKKNKNTRIRNLTPVSDFSSNNDNIREPISYPTRQLGDNKRPIKRNKEHARKPRRDSPTDQRELQIEKDNDHDTDYSLCSRESLNIQERPESPENSIHIDMHEYDTDSAESDDECSTESGWTFYKDILGQVNHLLENSNQPVNKPTKPLNKKKYVPTDTNTTLEQIKQNALQRLQNDGFLKLSDQCSIQPNEVSFAVKQILMKYLPDDGLANVVTKNKQEERFKNEVPKPSDVSLTSVKYMKQCNVTNVPPYYGRKLQATTTKNPSVKGRPQSGGPKILDITTLKQQPKLI